MNHDQAGNLLNDYLDGELSAEQTGELEDHLHRCETCTRDVENLRALLHRAAELPRELNPGRDLWPGIEKALGRMGSDESGRLDTAVRRTEEHQALTGRLLRFFRSLNRHNGLWVTTAAAAALLVVMVLAAVITPLSDRWRSAGTPILRSAEGEEPDSAVAAILKALDAECRQGEMELERYASLDGDTEFKPLLKLFEANIHVIDLAIRESREQWEADPGNSHLTMILTSAYRAKASLQRKALNELVRV